MLYAHSPHSHKTDAPRCRKLARQIPVEGREYPFYATQWHPERNAFDWIREENITHTRDAAETSQWVANFFVQQARENSHAFDSDAEMEAALIYNYNPKYFGQGVQIYYFPPTNATQRSRRNAAATLT